LVVFSNFVVFVNSSRDLSSESFLVHMKNVRLCAQKFLFNHCIVASFVHSDCFESCNLFFMLIEMKILILFEFRFELKGLLIRLPHVSFLICCFLKNLIDFVNIVIPLLIVKLVKVLNLIMRHNSLNLVVSNSVLFIIRV
jgi:hypothetical protein